MVGLLTKMRFNSRKHSQIIFVVLGTGTALIFLWIILNRAWVSDDAYITFRVVDNFLNGYGLRWNINERVQVFTHPLWMFLFSGISFFSGEVYFTSIFTGILLSMLTVVILLRIKKLSVANCMGVLLLAFSGAFVDYSTSGLENPLSHLLIVSFGYVYVHEKIKNRFFLLSFLCGLACFNRLDMVFFFLPAIAQVYFSIQNKKNAILTLFIGMLPVILWEIFSFLYFGFPFPNTYYAKLNHWLSTGELLRQGLLYLQHTALSDPITAIVIIIGSITSLIHWNLKRGMLSLGAFLYLLYVISIGGDFMEGRFLTGIFLVMVIELVLYEIDRIRMIHFGWILPLLIVFNFYSSVPTFLSYSWNFIEPWQDGIVNERAFYWPDTGLFRKGGIRSEPAHIWVRNGKDLREQSKSNFLVVEKMSIGFVGYYAGPNVHIIDELGLGSALTARIPPRRKANWRIGHFVRIIPEGYTEFLYTEDLEKIQDDDTRKFVAEIEKVVSDPLLSKDRLKAILLLNTGQLNHLLDQVEYHYPSLVVVQDEEIDVRKSGDGWNAEDNIIGFDSGILVNFKEPQNGNSFEASFALVQMLEVNYLDLERANICRQVFILPSSSRLRVYKFLLPEKMEDEIFSAIHFIPLREDPEKDTKFSMGHLIMDNR